MMLLLDTPGSTFDLMIASIAIAHQSKLLSRNLKEFQRVPGLDTGVR